MSQTFMRWFLISAVIVGSLHVGDTFSLMFDSSSAEAPEMFAATPTEAAAPRRS